MFFLVPLTFFIYGIVWFVNTKDEMNARGADIPTAWLLLVPFANLWWIWKYSEGVDKVTDGKISAVLSLILLLALGNIGMAVLQDSFNKVGAAQ